MYTFSNHYSIEETPLNDTKLAFNRGPGNCYEPDFSLYLPQAGMIQVPKTN